MSSRHHIRSGGGDKQGESAYGTDTYERKAMLLSAPTGFPDSPEAIQLEEHLLVCNWGVNSPAKAHSEPGHASIRRSVRMTAASQRAGVAVHRGSAPDYERARR